MAFRFKGTGTVKQVDSFTTSRGKEIVTIVVEVPDDKYPQLVPVKFFGRTADEAKSFLEGDDVEITGYLGGREYNGKFYGDIVGESLEDARPAKGAPKGTPPKQDEPPPPSDDDIPF